MGPKRIRVALFLSALVLGVIVAIVLGPRIGLGRPGTAARPSTPAKAPGAYGQNAARVAPAAGPDGRSELADGLNSPAGSVQADLRMIDHIFIAYRSALHMGNPIGDNKDITAVLKGRNKLGFEFIPADNPAINAKGELCDRWGTPYFFHQLSGEKMEIRSAGPDHKLWTADDVVLTP
jgi:hypothetical protein